MTHHITAAGGRSFELEPDESVLAAAERHGITLAYSCRAGRCSTCKALPREGTTRALQPELGLQTSEREEGWILTCVRTAETDVVLAVDSEVDQALPAPRTLPARVNRIQPAAPGVMKVWLRLPPSAQWDYLAGQHVDVIGPGGIRRSYSIANASDDEHVELHIARLDGGAMSSYWFEQAAAEDLLRIHGPLGTFFAHESDGPLIFLATGTGAAPVQALLREHRERWSATDVAVYVGARTEEDLYWRPDDGWPASWRYVPCLSRPDDDWEGIVGYVQDAAARDLSTFDDATVYACGSEGMIRGARELLVQAGLDPNRFHADAFVSTAPARQEW